MRMVGSPATQAITEATIGGASTTCPKALPMEGRAFGRRGKYSLLQSPGKQIVMGKLDAPKSGSEDGLKPWVHRAENALDERRAMGLHANTL